MHDTQDSQQGFSHLDSLVFKLVILGILKLAPIKRSRSTISRRYQGNEVSDTVASWAN